MKKALKVIGVVLGAIVILLCGVLIYVVSAFPNVGEAPELKVELTAERIERGRYLANAVNVCMDCHSTRDWNKFSGPVIPGTMGKGGERFDHSVGFPGVFYSRNITPSGIGRYTDGELFRVITSGVTKEGNAMFPVMPYPYYGQMDEEDVYSLIAYLRTLEPIDNEIPESSADFPVNIILRTMPAKGTPTKRPLLSDTVAYGAYMANAGGCIECHTPTNDQHQIIREKAFSGGREFGMPGGSVIRSANITQDPETGIGKWNRSAFIQRFKAYADSSYTPPTVAAGEFNTIMPWMMYANMTEEDLGAIYTYLRSLPGYKSEITKFTPAAAGQ
ncbi:cytochrome C [Chryseolinea sp. T2]|uniref:cytochrome C n=1 Tax=Chryseolinea sp. T2 TaxID=3129255 RepID=UPI00307716A7